MVNLRFFNPDKDLPTDFFFIIYGMRRTGKTTAALNILEQLAPRFKHHTVEVYTKTGAVNPLQWKNFPRSAIFTDIQNLQRALQHSIDEQTEDITKECEKQIREKWGKLKEAEEKQKHSLMKPSKTHETTLLKKRKRNHGKNGSIDPHAERISIDHKEPAEYRELKKWSQQLNIDTSSESTQLRPEDIIEARRLGLIDETKLPKKLLIFDDVVSEEIMRHSSAMNELPAAGRHLGFSVILLSQCICGSASVPPIVRINSDFIAVLGNPRSSRERQLLDEFYLNLGNTAAKEGLKILSEITRIKYRMLVIDVNNSTASDLSEVLMKYGPVPEPPNNVSKDFRLGTEKQWEKDSKHKTDVEYTNKDLKKPPDRTNAIHTIDGGRFSSKIQRITGSAIPDVPTPEFLEPFF